MRHQEERLQQLLDRLPADSGLTLTTLEDFGKQAELNTKSGHVVLLVGPHPRFSNCVRQCSNTSAGSACWDRIAWLLVEYWANS